MLAGLPKAPSAYNPVTNPKRARRPASCTCCGACTSSTTSATTSSGEAQNAPLAVRQALREVLPTHAEFVAEMARQVVFDAYGDEAYTRGLTVYTTIRKADQDAAYAAVRRGVVDYDRRHGYRGPEAYRQPARTTRPSSTTRSTRVFQDASDSDNLDAGGRPGGVARDGQGRA